MAKVHGDTLAGFAELKIGCGYVFSGQGEIYTPKTAQRWALQKRGGKDADYFLEDCKHWLGYEVYDCSGLIIHCLETYIKGYDDKAADTLRGEAVHVYGVSGMPDIRGLIMHRKGHTGVYIGNGFVVEAASTAKGVIKTPVKKPGGGKPWAVAYQHKDIDLTPRLQPQPNGLYKVVRGDTLSEIAARYKLPVSVLYEINKATIGPNPNVIQPGQLLKVTRSTYTVKPGDTLYGIAKALRISPKELYEDNKAIIGPDAGLIHPGQVLKI